MKDETKQGLLLFLETAALLLLTYPAGIAVGLWFLGGCLCGRLIIMHADRLSCIKTLDKVILVANHPAIIDPFLVAFLLFRYYLFHPLRHAPLIVADRINFYDKWWFLPFRSVMVPVDRGDRRKQAVALLKIRKAIERGRIVIIFPEGGRTFKGDPGEFLYSQMGNKIRFLREGVGLLVSKTGASVIPIGIKGSDEVVPNSRRRLWTRFVFWGRIKMCIGQPMTFSPEASRERITQEIAAKLLELVDEAS